MTRASESPHEPVLKETAATGGALADGWRDPEERDAPSSMAGTGHANQPSESFPEHQAAVDPATKVEAAARAARAAAHAMAPLDEADRNAALERIANALREEAEHILVANAADVADADTLVRAGALSESNRARLVLSRAKLEEMAAQVSAVAAQPDPLGQRLSAIELDAGLELEKMSVPIGVLLVIFESRPDAITQIAALAIKSGNAVLLKPGHEVERTATALIEALRKALSTSAVPETAVALVLGREQVGALLHLPHLVDLVIPRGSRALVEHIQANTRIPVLGHADGVCHIFVHAAADQEEALRIVDDSKTDYPAVCNAVETVLVEESIARDFLPKLLRRMTQRGVRVLTDEPTRKLIGEQSHESQGAGPEAQLGTVEDWHTEYGDLTLAVRAVRSLEDAIGHIHAFGSAHTEAICTQDAEAAERFLREVDAASVMVNASTRFADGFRYGLGAEVGISTSRIHARGPVGLEGLTTTKWLLRGHGQVVGTYRGKDARPFTHRPLVARVSAT